MKKIMPLMLAWLLFKGNGHEVAQLLEQIGPERANQTKISYCSEGLVQLQFCVFYPEENQGGK